MSDFFFRITSGVEASDLPQTIRSRICGARTHTRTYSAHAAPCHAATPRQALSQATHCAATPRHTTTRRYDATPRCITLCHAAPRRTKHATYIKHSRTRTITLVHLVFLPSKIAYSSWIESFFSSCTLARVHARTCAEKVKGQVCMHTFTQVPKHASCLRERARPHAHASTQACACESARSALAHAQRHFHARTRRTMHTRPHRAGAQIMSVCAGGVKSMVPDGVEGREPR